jgi:hypothetical protein
MSESTIYRSSTIAQCLSSSVDELVADDRIDADTADAIMEQFDKVPTELRAQSTSGSVCGSHQLLHFT